ncbi:hypothetical protein B0A54_16018 [Friedmanniomyces endolithicus]|uniref:GATOR2 complex protein MIO zinc-ribbon like domain-containing protein n=1 Tax=Friedmanniomyces endolithicus TaxID=329885 RepID=A0A4V5N4R0_9PEZI|nr:hypothetical protein B0A54_16018 [Friedmanniomyces endolithicus]
MLANPVTHILRWSVQPSHQDIKTYKYKADKESALAMEAAVRWSSTGDRRRFLVVDTSDSSLTLNEVDHVGHCNIEYRQITRYTKLPGFSAFSWSPVQDSLVVLGLVSGDATLIRLGEAKGTSDIIATFRVKQQRKCNSVALSSQHWLAVALDKTRSDVCLNVYDVNGDISSSVEPVRRLCAAEQVSSVRFFPSSPHELVATTQRSFIRIYDLRDSYIGAGGSASLQASTRHVNNVSIDPLDEHYFASVGSTADPSFTVWDKRWMTSSAFGGSNSGSVLSVSLAGETTHPTTIRNVRWSGNQRGRLALGTSRGEVRAMDIKEAACSVPRDSEYLPVNPYGGALWQNTRYMAQMRNVRPSSCKGKEDKAESVPISSFDWISSLAVDKTGLQRMIVLHPNHEVNVIGVPRANFEAQLSNRDDFVVVSGDHSTITATGHDRSPAKGLGIAKPWDSSTVSDLGADQEASGHDTETARAVRNGDLEGVLLTGLGEQAMKLFQTYIVRTGDLQTAVLATAISNPRYVDDVRWEMWKETYFEQMQTWRAFNERTKFTVQHARLARSAANGSCSSSLSQPPEKARVLLRCNHCQSALGRNRLNRTSSADGQVSSTTRLPGPTAHTGTVCLTCGRHMSRCAICALWLGTPSLAARVAEHSNPMARMLVFCLQCEHGYHADHAQEWFEKHGGVCAVPDCSSRPLELRSDLFL